MEYTTKCLIIGSGGAGCTAGIYTARAGLQPIMICGEPGGQLATTSDVENYPGFETISGQDLMDKMRMQAEKCGTKIITDWLTGVNLSKRPFIAKSSNNTYIADTIIIATGAKAKWLGLESEEKYKGYGVSACAVCDGNFYRNKVVAVVGGGNTAVTEALYLSKIAKKVYLIHRKNTFKAEQVLMEKLNNEEKIKIIPDSIVDDILGKEDALGKFVVGVKIKNTNDSETQIIDLDGVFVAIGHQPSTELFNQQLELTDRGYIKTNPITKETNVRGVFACGDVQDEYHKQAVVACGTGCICALEVEKFLTNDDK